MIKKQGITITMLVVTIVILGIVATTITISVSSTLNYSRMSTWANEISYIQDVVNEELSSESVITDIDKEITFNTSELTQQEFQQFDGESITSDTIKLYELDLAKLNITNVEYGHKETQTDIYAVSPTTGRVYYVKGVKLNGDVYYTLTDELKQRYEITKATQNLTSVVFVPNKIGYTNDAIQVIVKVPKTFTNIEVTTTNSNILIGSQVIKNTTYEYAVNINNVVGNYKVTVSYNDGMKSLTANYTVNGYDNVVPVIAPIVKENFVYKETENGIQDYLLNITATDESGIKVVKYALGIIKENEAEEYFKNNGNVLIDNKINLDREITHYTLYAEDNAGNWSISTFEKPQVTYKWLENVSEIVDEVPIPKGFVASPYGANLEQGIKAENTKDGGFVIYELKEGETQIPSTETQYDSWTTRNQYVWIPVVKEKFDTEFVRKNFGMDYTISSKIGNDYWEVDPTTADTEENLQLFTKETLEEVQNMYASVKEYGGFYIARYEAGVDDQRLALGNAKDMPGINEEKKVYSVMGKIPYIRIPFSWESKMNDEKNGAVEVARKLYSKDETKNKTGVISTLTYGVQRDRAIQWLIDTRALTLEEVNTTEGSIEYGNYSNHVINTSDELNKGALVWNYTENSQGSYIDKDNDTLIYPKQSGTWWALSTGALKSANINNVYDMAGNMHEWTVESYSTIEHSYCGGSFSANGKTNPISFRNPYEVGSWGDSVTIRIALYIKLPT